MELLIQRLKVCLRLAYTAPQLWRRGLVQPTDFLHIRKRGNGLASTFLIGEKVVVKVRNELASAGNRALYNGKFDGLFAYSEDEERFRREFEIYAWLADEGRSARPLLLNKSALVTTYIPNAGTLIADGTLSQKHIAMIFDVMGHLHRDGLFHGDLNLDNFILGHQGLYVIDFESSRRFEANEKGRLAALDLIIFLEKLDRFHPEVFRASIPALRASIAEYGLNTSAARDMARKYLPTGYRESLLSDTDRVYASAD